MNIKYIIFIIIGIIIFYYLNNKDTFSIGVPWCIVNGFNEEAVIRGNTNYFVFGNNMYYDYNLSDALIVQQDLTDSSQDPNESYNIYWCNEKTEFTPEGTTLTSNFGFPSIQECMSPLYPRQGFDPPQGQPIKNRVNIESTPILLNDNVEIHGVGGLLNIPDPVVPGNEVYDYSGYFTYTTDLTMQCSPNYKTTDNQILTCLQRKQIVMIGLHGRLEYNTDKSITMVPKNMQVHFYLNTRDCASRSHRSGPTSMYEFSKTIIDSLGNENEYLLAQQIYMEELSPVIVNQLDPLYSSRNDPPAILGRFAKKTYSELKTINYRSLRNSLFQQRWDTQPITLIPYIDGEINQYMIYYKISDERQYGFEELLRILRDSGSMKEQLRFGIMGPFCQNLALILDDSNISALNAIPERENIDTFTFHGFNDINESISNLWIDTNGNPETLKDEMIAKGMNRLARIEYDISSIETQMRADLKQLLLSCCVQIDKVNLRQEFFDADQFRGNRLFGLGVINDHVMLPLFCQNTYLDGLFKNGLDDDSLDPQLRNVGDNRYTAQDIRDVINEIVLQIIDRNGGFYDMYIGYLTQMGLTPREINDYFKMLFQSYDISVDPEGQSSAAFDFGIWQDTFTEYSYLTTNHTVTHYIGDNIHQALWGPYGYRAYGTQPIKSYKIKGNTTFVLLQLFKQVNGPDQGIHLDVHLLTCMKDLPEEFRDTTDVKMNYGWSSNGVALERGLYNDKKIGPTCEPIKCVEPKPIVVRKAQEIDRQYEIRDQMNQDGNVPRDNTTYDHDDSYNIIKSETSIDGTVIPIYCKDYGDDVYAEAVCEINPTNTLQGIYNINIFRPCPKIEEPVIIDEFYSDPSQSPGLGGPSQGLGSQGLGQPPQGLGQFPSGMRSSCATRV